MMSTKEIYVPPGWRRVVEIRKAGIRKGRLDIQYFSPAGTRLRSKGEVQKYCFKHNIKVDLNEFMFYSSNRPPRTPKSTPKSSRFSSFSQKRKCNFEEGTVKKKKKKKEGAAAEISWNDEVTNDFKENDRRSYNGKFGNVNEEYDEFWPLEEELSLYSRIQSQLSHKDIEPFDKTLCEINWEEIAFDDRSAEECEDMFYKLIMKIEKQKPLSMILDEVREYVTQNTTGLRKMKNVGNQFVERYSLLSRSEGREEVGLRRKAAELWLSLHRNQRKQLKAVMEKESRKECRETMDLPPDNPRNPFVLYYDTQSSKMGLRGKEVRSKYMKIFNEMEFEEKMPYIHESLKEWGRYLIEFDSYKVIHPEFNKPKLKLFNYRKICWQYFVHLGMPKYITNIMGTVHEEMKKQGKLDSIDAMQQLPVVSAIFKNLSSEERQEYNEKHKAYMATYDQAYKSWKESLDDGIALVLETYFEGGAKIRLPKGWTPKNATPKSETTKDGTPETETPKSETTKDGSPETETPKSETTKDGIPETETTGGGVLQDEIPKEAPVGVLIKGLAQVRGVPRPRSKVRKVKTPVGGDSNVRTAENRVTNVGKPVGEVPNVRTTVSVEKPVGKVPSAETSVSRVPSVETPLGEVPSVRTPLGEVPNGVTAKSRKVFEFKNVVEVYASTPPFLEEPNAPPCSAFDIFALRFNNRFKDQFESSQKLSNACKSVWESLAEETKSKYVERDEENKEIYKESLLKYVRKLGFNMKAYLGFKRLKHYKFFGEDIFESEFPNVQFPVYKIIGPELTLKQPVVSDSHKSRKKKGVMVKSSQRNYSLRDLPIESSSDEQEGE